MINFADVHRLPQHRVVKKGKNITRPIIFKLLNSFDLHQICKSLKHFIEYIEKLNLKLKQPGYAYIIEHLLHDLQLQKKRLLSHYQQAMKENKKVTWKINDGYYQLLCRLFKSPT